MKKFTGHIAAVLALALMTGCANGQAPAGTTAAQTTTTTAADTTAADTTAADTTAADTTAADTTAADTTAADVTKTPIYTGICDKVYYREDASVGEFGELVFPTAVMRVSSGMYLDSEKNPELFVPDEFEYSGERADLGTVIQIAEGDKIKDCTVKEAHTYFMSPWNDALGGPDPDAKEGFTPSGIGIKLDGDVTLTGMLRFYFDEQYAISSGDIQFIADNSYEGFPVPIDISGGDDKYGVTDFDAHGGFDPDQGYLEDKWGGGVCVYSDTVVLHLGNLFSDYADRTELYDILGGGKANSSAKVEITLTDLDLSWNDNFGTAYSCTAKIKDVKAVS